MLPLYQPPTLLPAMFWTRKNKEEHRYYLLPGMGRSNRRRRKQFIRWAVFVGIIVSVLFGWLLYYFGRWH